jgi:hypothetical protein
VEKTEINQFCCGVATRAGILGILRVCKFFAVAKG